MTVVEARYPDGSLCELTEANLTKSGLLIMITDTRANQVLIHRFAWDNLVKAINELFEEEKWQSEKTLKGMLEKEDPHL